MNWGKAKTRLIILFLSINLLLAWANYNKDIGVYTLKETQVNDIKKVLEMDNIYVDCPIPKAYKPIQKLTVLPYQIDGDRREDIAERILGKEKGITISLEGAGGTDGKPKRIYRRGDQVVIFEGEDILYRDEGSIRPKEPISIKEAKKMAEKWLEGLEYVPKAMHLQVIEDEEEVYMVYYDQYEGTPIFDSYVKMHITPSGIVESKIHKMSLGELIGAKQTIYPSNQVFFSLIETIRGTDSIHIQDIMIGYGLENPKGTHLIAEEAIPFYQIILKDGETYYINAYNNELRDETPPIMDDLQ